MPFSFQTLFIDQLNELYSAEEQITVILPNIIAVSSSMELRDLLDLYLQEVNKHIKSLDACFQEINEHPSGEKCKPIEGMMEETEAVIHRGGNSAIKDAALIAIVQRVIHFKIAVYGTARTFARHLNYRAMDILQRSLNEEGEADRYLTRLAEGGIFSTGINEAACRSKVYA